MSQYYILVEGESDKYFLKKYLKSLNIKIKENNIQSCDGKDNLKKYSNDIEKNINEGNKVIVIFDADDNYVKSLEAIKNKLGNLQDGVEIFLFPNNEDEGELETLLTKIAKKPEFIECFENYLKCIESKNCAEIKKVNKSMLFAYLEACGEDCKKYDLSEIFDLESEYIKPLREFLEGAIK